MSGPFCVIHSDYHRDPYVYRFHTELQVKQYLVFKINGIEITHQYNRDNENMMYEDEFNAYMKQSLPELVSQVLDLRNGIAAVIVGELLGARKLLDVSDAIICKQWYEIDENTNELIKWVKRMF